MSIVAVVVLLLPVVGPSAASARASVVTTGDVDPGGADTQPDPWVVGGNLYVGKTGTGTLNVETGGVVSNTHGYIGNSSSSTGTAMITGSGSQWNNSSLLFVGRAGNGTLNVEAGSVVSNTYGYIGHYADSTGTATITGTNSQWNNSIELRVGYEGTGTLNVTAGGFVSNTDGVIGSGAGSSSVATVTGSGSKWNNSRSLSVGSEGSGTLNVEAGGVVSNTSGGIGRWSDSTGEVTVTGSGSQWNNSGMLHVGREGNGTLNVTDGGVVSNTTGYIARAGGTMGVATVTGSGSQWNNSKNLTVGRLGTGTLNVTDGGTVSNTYSYIGIKSGSTGEATVTGFGSQWNNSNSLYVGGKGSQAGGAGILNIADSGLVTVGNTMKLWSTGTVNLDGGRLATGSFDNSDTGTLNFHDGTLKVKGAGGMFNPGTTHFTIDGLAADDLPALVIANTASAMLSEKLTVGFSNRGQLIVKAGSVVSNMKGYIGKRSGSTGVAMVKGSGSQWNNVSLWVGRAGAGTLNVMAGGIVSNIYSYIGRAGGSTGKATVTGAGSQWHNSGHLHVGRDGNATLIVGSGGTVSNINGYIGQGFRSTGQATISGENSTWSNSKGLYIGGNNSGTGGTGILNIVDRGLVTVGKTTKLWSDGTINLDGGTLDVGVLDLTLGGTFNMLDGYLHADSVVGDLNNQGGILAPDNSPGILTVTSDYVQGAAATLEIELGGTVRGDGYDAMIVGGDLTLDGNLNVAVKVGRYEPQAGDLFDILDFEPTNLSGLFDAVNLPALASDLEWDQSNLYTTGELLVSSSTSQASGDFDGGFESDVDGDGSVGGDDDFLIWQNNFPYPTALSSVPEPNSLALLAISALLMLRRRRT